MKSGDAMVISVLTFAVCFLLRSLIVQLTCIFLGYKEKNPRVVDIGLIALIVLPNVLMLYAHNITSVAVKLAIIIAYYIGCFFLYTAIYRKINLKILYIYLLTINTPQIYANITKQIFSENRYSDLLAFLLEALVLGSILIYIKRKKYEVFVQHLVEALPKKLYILVLGLTYIASIFVMGSTRPNHDLYVRVLLIPSMIGLMIVLFSIIRTSISETEKTLSVNILSKQIENQIEYYNKINSIYDEFRCFRHDFKNHILCLRSLISAGETERAIEYMNEIEVLSSVEKKKFDTGNIIVDALLSDKSEKALASNTRLDFKGFVPTSGISNADLCIIIANAVDNAIEACAKDSSNEEKIITANADFKRGYFFFRISNPMFEKVKINDKNKVVTSKEDKSRHGFGVSNIVRVANKYNGAAEISADGGVFTLDVQLLLDSSIEA